MWRNLTSRIRPLCWSRRHEHDWMNIAILEWLTHPRRRGNMSAISSSPSVLCVPWLSRLVVLWLDESHHPSRDCGISVTFPQPAIGKHNAQNICHFQKLEHILNEYWTQHYCYIRIKWRKLFHSASYRCFIWVFVRKSVILAFQNLRNSKGSYF